jgi:hypothetical protein
MRNQVAVANEARTESQLGVTLMMITFRASVVMTLFVAGLIGIFGVATGPGLVLGRLGPVSATCRAFPATSHTIEQRAACRSGMQPFYALNAPWRRFYCIMP